MERARHSNARLRLESLAQWWTQAQDRERFGLLQRVQGTKTPLKGQPSLSELYLAIFLAESSAGEIESG